ncbi:sugar nucleotidyltransferase [Natrialba magadii ATCC 43099]|uniref:Nucleotidyl transferase n=1 Tax=Natrialba magadii (strain ATCC 43099 / DSM 3394 / CCM 3739 / CIP 104546 / IAM 13178 / JCM 8861 / NBRC 102185 / NCIMB 2190 / MS3) TaxID=547559 RepID=D3SQS5_NATMM|nr:nucleotidyltransferase family protein [Natrialba magadii]ADD04563.1 sugar nucleotidyltransferase [Natrialba magadii ATCC 43099]ELY25220.1 nucleotidyl transferase [Natrialba magadii ATCC 43099]
MHALVFAAGRGTRLQPYTDDTPKPLLEIAGEPLLRRTLQTVADTVSGIEQFTIVVGYRGDEIVDCIGDTFDGVPVSYAWQRNRQGLAHAVCRAAEDGYGVTLESVDENEGEGEDEGEDKNANVSDTAFPDDILIINGDNALDCDLSALVDRHREPSVDGALLLDRVSRNEAEATALCSLADDGRIRSVESTLERGQTTGYMAAGVQTHDGPALLDACRTLDRADSGEFELTAALESLLADGAQYVGVELEGWHRNVNTPADLQRARERFEGAASDGERSENGGRW